MRDRIGNKVSAGDLLVWLQNQMVCEVIEATDDDTPQIERPGAPKHRPLGMVEVKFKMPVSREGIAPGVECMLIDFIRVMNPKSEDALERLMQRPAVMPPRKQ